MLYGKSINNNENSKIEHTNLVEKVYRRIIDAILDGTFSLKKRLVCNDIAKHFGVSRTPVREALVRLEKEGFIHFIPRSGTYVNSFAPEEMKEIYEIREVLEGVAARMAAITPDSDLLEKMGEACENYKLGIEHKDVDLCIESDLLFHRTLVKISGSKRLIEMLEGFHIQSISIAKRGPGYWIRVPTYLDEHYSILDLISQRKGRLAEKKVREHIRKGAKGILE